MMPWAFRLFAVYFAAVVAAPGVLFVRFEARRGYIERELCVQRDVMEGMRTCHGECVLAKQYKALEHEAEEGFPVERMVRYEPVAGPEEEAGAFVLPVVPVCWADTDPVLHDGFGGRVEHVPRG
ncbi:MAG: hypothetical protein RBT71_14045 [Flavobacteriales bacterium]|jgi:hypothetical protein|nr:hypothetical protein [Flavobacteriales bacterium]